MTTTSRAIVLIALIATTFVACAPSRPDADGPSSAGTRAMAERLARIAAEPTSSPESETALPFPVNSTGAVQTLRRRLAETEQPELKLQLRLTLAQELLRAGDTEPALSELETAEQELSRLTGRQRGRWHLLLLDLQGIAGLRLAEQENCLHHHSVESCLFPIRGGGIHGVERGSRLALAAYGQRLTQLPRDLGTRWLLNLAHMTLGEYPERVPNAWLLPPELFHSDQEFKRFPNVAKPTGLDSLGLAGGSVVEDLDGDGDLDVVASSCGVRDQLRLFRNDGDGTFTERTSEAGLAGEIGGLNLNHADYDNDGDADILVLRGGWRRESGNHPNSLLRNRGDGTFEDVTEAAGLLAFHATQAAAWADYDNDGQLDLFIGNEQWLEAYPHPSQLFRNRGDGTFVDCAPALSLAELGTVKGVAWGDYDNDGRQDLYVSRFNQPNLLFHNDGGRGEATGDGDCPPWGFSEVSERAGVREPQFSFPTWFWDYDNDGWLDIFAGPWKSTSIGSVAARYLGLEHGSELPRLFRNNGDGTFRDVTAEVRLDRVLLVMGANYGDLDNDGFLDVYLGTGAPDLRCLMPNRMFRNDGGRRFNDVTTAGGFGHLQKGHGVSFGDLDNDGDQDIFTVMGGWFTGDVFQNALFENPGFGNHWITVSLEGVRSTRSGVGARLKLRLRTPSGSREVHATVSTGGSFGSSPLQQEIGLGDAEALELLEVHWPASGETQTFRDVAMDRFIRIREGHPEILPLSRTPIPFAR